jgi:hypothetical protein
MREFSHVKEDIRDAQEVGRICLKYMAESFFNL